MKRPGDDTPEIEPLSDVAWARVERRLFGRLQALPYRRDGRARPRTLRVAALMLAAALLTGGALYGVTASLRPSTGKPGRDVSRVVTQQSATRVSLTGAALEVAPRSSLSITGDDADGLLVLLESGKVAAEVAPRHGRPPFVVVAGDVRVQVVGTRFSVTRSPEIEVEVTEGIVEVTRGAERALVAAGERWPARRAEAMPVAPPNNPAPAPRTVEVTPVRGLSPAHHAPRAPEAPPAAAPLPAPPPTAPTPPPSIAPVLAPAQPERDRDQDAFEAAARLEAKDPDGARRGYQAVAQGSGAWAANALYAVGRLHAEQRQVAEARRALDDYLRRFPRGANAADARRLLEQLK